MGIIFKNNKLVIASSNQGKLREFQDLLKDFDIEILLSSSLGVTEVEETGATFAENALIKAKNAYQQTGLTSIADDSGLVVEALNGAPGVYSARFAIECGGYEKAMQKVQELIKSSPTPNNFNANFTTALALVKADGTTEIFPGITNGHLTFPPIGNGGFGYDPMFIPAGQNKTFAEMELSEKQTYSHRAMAVKEFKNFVENA